MGTSILNAFLYALWCVDILVNGFFLYRLCVPFIAFRKYRCTKGVRAQNRRRHRGHAVSRESCEGSGRTEKDGQGKQRRFWPALFCLPPGARRANGFALSANYAIM